MTDVSPQLEWWHWPDGLTPRIPKAYSVSMQVATFPDSEMRQRFEQIFAKQFGADRVQWDWGGVCIARVLSGGVDQVPRLREAVLAAAQLTTIYIATLHIPEGKKPKADPAIAAEIHVVERKLSETPSPPIDWWPHAAPAWIVDERLKPQVSEA